MQILSARVNETYHWTLFNTDAGATPIGTMRACRSPSRIPVDSASSGNRAHDGTIATDGRDREDNGDETRTLAMTQ